MPVYLLQGLALGLPAAFQPGPFMAYLLAKTIRNGWRRTLPAALAPLLSDGPIILLVLLVLTQLPQLFLRGLQVAGGFFLLYLAWRALQSFRETAGKSPGSEEIAGRSLLEAALVNALNPNPYIFWTLVAGPILLAAWRSNPTSAVAFLAGFYGTLVGGFALLIILFATTQRLGSGVSRVLNGISVVALAGFGFYQVYTGLTAGTLAG